MLRGLRDSLYWTAIGSWLQWILASLRCAEFSHLLDDIQRGVGKLYWWYWCCHQVALLVVQENTSFKVQQSFHLRALSFHIQAWGSQAHSHRIRVRRQSVPSPTCASASLPTCFKDRNLWKAQTMQFRKTRKDFWIKQERAALLACEWCCTVLGRKLDALYQLAWLVCLQFML